MRELLCLSLTLIMVFSLYSCTVNKKVPTSSSVTNESQVSRSEQTLGTSQDSGNFENQTNQKKSERKVLIAYFSQARSVSEGADSMSSATPYVGNTASAAYEIQKIMGGDIFEIVTEEKYPVSHKECSAIAEEEMNSNARPALTTHVEDIDSYDVIFIGYPIWWYIEPMAIRTFLEEYNLSGKTIVPFCTTLEAGVDESVKDIQSMCPNSTVLNGLTLSTGQKDVSGDISKWLNKLDLSE